MMGLMPYKVLTWYTGYGWVQQRAIRFLDCMSLPTEDRHHALILQILTKYGYNIMEHFRSEDSTLDLHKMIQYIFANKITMEPAESTNTEVPGRPSYFGYMRDKVKVDTYTG